MSRSPSLVGRALLALILMIGFYLLALAMAGGFLYLLYVEWRILDRTHPMLGFLLTLLCGLGAGVIVWSIVPRFWDQFEPPGLLLEPEEHPRLFDALADIAASVGQEMPVEVYLDPDVNAWVAQRGGFLGLGSRRVMGLGLPLLQVLTVSQFRAVLVHEYGHYHGGDTALGPWVYTTRDAISRVVRNLKVSLLRKVFLVYGLFFLRLTHAVSRHQEYAADALAARLVGSRALINGLRRLHVVGTAFGPFWRGEVVPALDAGYRPSFTDGFARFFRSKTIAELMGRVLDAEIDRPDTDPYNTHPPLRDRIEAVREIAPGEAPAVDPLAISLLEDLPGLEVQLLARLFGHEHVEVLRPVRWEDVGTRVYLPQWQERVQEYAPLLKGITPRALPELAQKLDKFGKGLGLSVGKTLGRQEAADLAVATLGAALAVTLKRRGWALAAEPGVAVTLTRGDATIEPFHVLLRLASDDLPAEVWRHQCAQCEIADLSLGSVAVAPRRN
jgi:heat shock protein HtpX